MHIVSKFISSNLCFFIQFFKIRKCIIKPSFFINHSIKFNNFCILLNIETQILDVVKVNKAQKATNLLIFYLVKIVLYIFNIFIQLLTS